MMEVEAFTRTHIGLPRFLTALHGGWLELVVPAIAASHAWDLLASPRDALFPQCIDYWSWKEDGDVELLMDLTEVTVAALARLPDLPVKLTMEHEQIGSVEDQFLAAVDTDLANILWWVGSWPAVPKLALDGQANYVGIELVMNGEGIEERVPRDDHTLYVHVPSREDARVQWLAEFVGQTVIGSKIMGY